MKIRTSILFLHLYIACACPSPPMQALAENPKTKRPSNDSASELPTMESRSFDTSTEDLSTAEPIVDRDETDAGISRLREIEIAAREILATRTDVERERRDPAARRDILAGEVLQAQTRINNASAQMAQANRNIAILNQRISILPQELATGMISQKRELERLIATSQNTIRICSGLIESRTPTLAALNNQIRPLDDRLSQLWNELEEARKQWLEIRQPLNKFSRGDFELLRRVLDDWLLIDGLWPEAHVWAALCAYETGDFGDAFEYIEKSEEIRLQVFRAQMEWPSNLLMRLMVGKRLPGQNKRLHGLLEKASRLNEKSPSSFIYFLIGKYYSEQPNSHMRSKKSYESALAINPRYICAQIAIARLQVTSPDPKVRDVNEGLKTLERMWEKTGSRSWRLAGYLGDAYYQAGQRSKASELWNVALKSSPSSEAREEIGRKLSQGVLAPSTARQSTVAGSRAGQSEQYRTWNDATGNFRVEARFVRLDNNEVELLKERDGSTVRVPLNKLSQGDQAWIAKQSAK